MSLEKHSITFHANNQAKICTCRTMDASRFRHLLSGIKCGEFFPCGDDPAKLDVHIFKRHIEHCSLYGVSEICARAAAKINPGRMISDAEIAFRNKVGNRSLHSRRSRRPGCEEDFYFYAWPCGRRRGHIFHLVPVGRLRL